MDFSHILIPDGILHHNNSHIYVEFSWKKISIMNELEINHTKNKKVLSRTFHKLCTLYCPHCIPTPAEGRVVGDQFWILRSRKWDNERWEMNVTKGFCRIVRIQYGYNTDLYCLGLDKGPCAKWQKRCHSRFLLYWPNFFFFCQMARSPNGKYISSHVLDDMRHEENKLTSLQATLAPHFCPVTEWPTGLC